MNSEANKIWRLFGTIFCLAGAAFCLLYTLVAIVTGIPYFLVSTLIGGPFLALGLFFLKKIRDSEKTENEVVENGMRVEAVITDIYEDTSITINDRHPWIAEASYDDPKTMTYYTFQVNTGMYPLSEKALGAKVTVFVDPLDFERYAVDLDSIEYEEEEDLADLLTAKENDLEMLQKR